jgi:hypothetical protein
LPAQNLARLDERPAGIELVGVDRLQTALNLL